MRVLIVGAAPCDRIRSRDLLIRLDAESDMVIAVDAGAEHCEAAGIVPGLIIGDLDSLSEGTELRLKAEGTLVARFPSDKDESDLDLAIVEARARGATMVTMCCVEGGRTDHFLAAIGSLARAADMHPVIVEPDTTVWLVDASNDDLLEVAGVGTRLSVLPIEGAAVVSVDGVRWPLSHERLDPLSSRGISNVVTAAAATVRAHEGVVVVIADERD